MTPDLARTLRAYARRHGVAAAIKLLADLLAAAPPKPPRTRRRAHVLSFVKEAA